MRIQLEVEIETKDDGTVAVDEPYLTEHLYVLTGRIREAIAQYMPSGTRIKIEAYKGTERLDGACLGRHSR